MRARVHYVLPLTVLLLLGEKPRTAATLAILGILPDVDALLLLHRSLSHSIIVMALIIAPPLIYTRSRRPDLQHTLILAFLVLASHPILDLETYTPILWPITSNSYSLKLSLNAVMQKGFSLKPAIVLNTVPTVFETAQGFDYPLFTENGVLIAVILLAPIIYNQIKKNRINTSASAFC